MAGAVIENLSSRKLAGLCVALLLALLTCFLLGGLLSPAPISSHSVLGTICLGRKHEPQRWFQVWPITDGQKMCNSVTSVELLIDSGSSSHEVVFAFQLPLKRGGFLVNFSRWQQNLIGVLQLDIDHDGRHEMASNATLPLRARLGYKNKGDTSRDWTLLAASVGERHVDCDLDPEYKYRYNCELIPLFELGSLHHDYYLLNLRLPTDLQNNRNVDIGRLVDISLVTIFQNGGFTKVWVSLKTFFFPLVVTLLVWFSRRMHALKREPALIECMVFALGVSLTVLNLPLEYLTLRFDIPYMLLITSVRQWMFYATLLFFWLVFAGEHLTASYDYSKSRLVAYWKHMSAVGCGCISLLIFDMYKRGVQLANPFDSIWNTRAGTNLAVSFVVIASVLAGLYFGFLSWTIWRVFCNISVKRQVPLNVSPVRLLHSEDIIYRLKLLMLATLACAAMTVIGFILGQVAEGQWRWDEDISLSYTSALLTGVYGMWNVYTVAVICLYAPSHKR